MDAELDTTGGDAVLRFERRFAHPVHKVWHAITDPAEMAHWFPAAIETELKAGAKMRFVFPDEAPIDLKMTEGEVLEFDPPKVYTFRWNADVLRFELVPDGDGCRLFFSQTLGGGPIGRLAAGRNAAGWDTCLETLAGILDGNRDAVANGDSLQAMRHYIKKFELDRPEIDGDEIRFARDVVWQPADRVWELLTGGEPVKRGALPPASATGSSVPAGPVTAVEAPHLLEYQLRRDGEPAGRVRWEIIDDGALGVRLELTHTGPPASRLAALANWRRYLDKFFDSLFAGENDGPDAGH
ncbi:SRPBCC family protein [Amycolatopsis pigmentata]|uniref:SRPBCC family protein n=1 Tax=Amycolatopsis pigmentata TaxID=450801 RepID=A0ABW5G464_9PSEU